MAMTKDTKSGSYIIQFDNIVIENEYEMYLNLFNNKLLLNMYCAYTKFIPIEEFRNRANKLYFKDILKPEILNNDALLHSAIADILANTTNVNYDNCIHGQVCDDILLNPVFLSMSNVKEIYVLIEYTNETINVRNKKIEFIKKYFKHNKIKILCFNTKNNFAEFLIKKNINWTVYITDNVVRIKNIAETYQSLENKEFNIAYRSWSEHNSILDILIWEKGGAIENFE